MTSNLFYFSGVLETSDWVKEYRNEFDVPVDEQTSVKKRELHDKWAHEYLDNAIDSTL